MGREEAKNFNQSLQAIKLLHDPEQAMLKFEELCQNYQGKYPTFMAALVSKKVNYFAFMHLPMELRKYFYTTNAVESFNSILEKSRQKMGGFFQSEECLKVNVFFTLKKLNEHKWKNGVPHIKANLYSLRQLFATRYERLPCD